MYRIFIGAGGRGGGKRSLHIRRIPGIYRAAAIFSRRMQILSLSLLRGQFSLSGHSSNTSKGGAGGTLPTVRSEK